MIYETRVGIVRAWTCECLKRLYIGRIQVFGILQRDIGLDRKTSVYGCEDGIQKGLGLGFWTVRLDLSFQHWLALIIYGRQRGLVGD